MIAIRRVPYHLSVVADSAHLNESHLATPEAIAPLRHSVADYARAGGIRGEQLERVRLAVSEALTNVVLHAYRGEPGQVHVTARIVDDELWVLIADDGVGLSVPALRPGLGWGLAFITDAADEFTLAERSGGGSEARMVFRLRAASVAGGDTAFGDAADAGTTGTEMLGGDEAVGDGAVSDSVLTDADR